MTKARGTGITLAVFLLGLCSQPLLAGSEIVANISSPIYPVLVQGKELPLLVGTPIRLIQAYRLDLSDQSDHPKKIPVQIQIDQRNPKGLILLSEPSEGSLLQANDEVVFLAKDVGPCRADASVAEDPGNAAQQPLLVVDHTSHQQGCVYFSTESLGEPSKDVFVHYNAKTDSVSTQDFQLTFSPTLPMMIDKMQWKDTSGEGYKPSIIQGMFVEHQGFFLKSIDFVRGSADYKSKLIGVKAGPIRVIRRTENQVRIVLQLKSPSIYIDYVVYPNQMNMDMILDLPFKASWFFKDIKTLSALMLPNDQGLRLTHASLSNKGVADGVVSPDELPLNESPITRLAILNDEGGVFMRMDKATDLPIREFSYLKESKPSTMIGFDTRDWDKLEARQYHYIFSAFFLPAGRFPNGFEVLDKMPVPPLQ